MASEAEHLAALLQALDDAGAEPYTIQQEQRVVALPPNYTQVALGRRFGGVLRASAATGRRGYRFTLRACGRTHEDAVRFRDLARDAVEYARFTIDEVVTTPIQFEVSNEIELEPGLVNGRTTSSSLRAGYYTGIESYTYVH